MLFTVTNAGKSDDQTAVSCARKRMQIRTILKRPAGPNGMEESVHAVELVGEDHFEDVSEIRLPY